MLQAGCDGVLLLSCRLVLTDGVLVLCCRLVVTVCCRLCVVAVLQAGCDGVLLSCRLVVTDGVLLLSCRLVVTDGVLLLCCRHPSCFSDNYRQVVPDDAGQVYDADEQCAISFGTGSYFCRVRHQWALLQGT